MSQSTEVGGRELSKHSREAEASARLLISRSAPFLLIVISFRMESTDLEKLCFRLSSLRADQLYKLDDAAFLGTPKIRGMRVPKAVATLRSHIAAIPEADKRLRCVSRIYALLMPEGVIGPWTLYRVPEVVDKTVHSPWSRFLRELCLKDEPIYARKLKPDCIYACAIVPQSDSLNVDQEFYCLCFWTSSPCVAVHKPPEGYSNAENQLIRKILDGDPGFFKVGDYDDLHTAQRAIRQPSTR